MPTIKAEFLRRIIASKSYYQTRVDKMERECNYFLDQAHHASNIMLRRAFIKTAAMYYKRHYYYINKVSNNEFRKSLQN